MFIHFLETITIIWQGLPHKKLTSNSHRYLYRATSPGGHCWGCYPGALSSMSDHCDSPGDRVPIDEICEHFVVGWVEMTWISKGSGVSVAVLVMVAGSCARIIFNYMWLYNCILITVMLDNKPFWNWIEKLKISWNASILNFRNKTSKQIFTCFCLPTNLNMRNGN